MNIAVVGVGTIGSRHASNLRDAGHGVLTIDPAAAADASDLGRISRRRVSSLDAWVVSSPTDTHLETLRRILELQADARVLLEKPAVCPAQIAELTALLHGHPDASVRVNNVYGHSEAVGAFSRAVHRIAVDDPIRSVTVEFTKNRLADVAAGRFVDRDYGEIGYEWFHMMAVLRRVLPRREYRSFLATDPAEVTDEIRVRGVGPDFPRIDLYASMRGVIGFPRLAMGAFASPESRRRIATARIPYGCSLRYRTAHVRFASGAQAGLVFEPGHGVSEGYRNCHAVHVRSRTGARRTTEIRGNQLKDAVLAQLALLTGASGVCRTEIYRPEHEYMAALARSLAPWPASTRSPRPPNGTKKVTT
ncbi:Gfo/Idh/MocA family oxidoreductase [Streptomyces sp. NPDC006984]|uniref:Gfo/Idh/MocA family oxidoreductase n=1 Tax=unclassified Streptomyces TaxID=2593676 RepID=UPI0033FEC949